MQRRRHRLMARRTTRGRAPRRGAATVLLVLLGRFGLSIAGTVFGTTFLGEIPGQLSFLVEVASNESEKLDLRKEAIDAIMKLGMNHPRGPRTLADCIGLDVCRAILNVLQEGLGDPKYRACPLLKRYVDAGWLGRKSGRGFYEY